jgi:hypothetical protein
MSNVLAVVLSVSKPVAQELIVISYIPVAQGEVNFDTLVAITDTRRTSIVETRAPSSIVPAMLGCFRQGHHLWLIVHVMALVGHQSIMAIEHYYLLRPLITISNRCCFMILIDIITIHEQVRGANHSRRPILTSIIAIIVVLNDVWRLVKEVPCAVCARIKTIRYADEGSLKRSAVLCGSFVTVSGTLALHPHSVTATGACRERLRRWSCVGSLPNVPPDVSPDTRAVQLSLHRDTVFYVEVDVVSILRADELVTSKCVEQEKSMGASAEKTIGVASWCGKSTAE